MGRSKRCELEKSLAPGPGAYEMKPRPTTPNTLFTKSPRIV